jgi:hypothetical protein
MRTLGAALRKSRAARRAEAPDVVPAAAVFDPEFEIDLRAGGGAPAPVVPSWQPFDGHSPGS